MATPTETGPEVYIATMKKFLSDSNAALEEPLNNLKNIKIRRYLEDNLEDLRNTILLYSKYLENDRQFKPVHLGFTTNIFETTSNYRFCFWYIQRHTEVSKVIKKLHVCDEDIIQPEEIIIYESLVQEATHECFNLVDSKW